MTNRVWIIGLLAAILLSQQSTLAAQPDGSGWTRLNSPLAPGGVIQSIAPSVSDPQRLYAVLSDSYLGQQLLRSDDTAQSWQVAHTFPASRFPLRLAADPAISSTVFAGSVDTLWRSTDSGVNWTEVYTSGAAVTIISSTLAYVGVSVSGPDTSCVGGRLGISRSMDGGGSWQVIPVGCGGGVNAIAVLASNPALILVGGTESFCDIKCYTYSVIYRSQNGGQTWDNQTTNLKQAAPSAASESQNPSSSPVGFQSVSPPPARPAGANGDGGLRGLALDAAQPNRAYGLTGEGFFYSLDQGQTWQSSGLFCVYCSFVQSGPTLYLMRSLIGSDVPIYRSDDGGAHWWQSVTQYPAYSSAMAPMAGHPGDYYLSLYGRGIWQSHDDGSSFAERNQGIDSTLNVTRIYPSPTNPAAQVVAGGPRPMLVRTDNGGASWTRVLTDVNVTAFALDPALPNGYFFAASGLTFDPAFRCELYETTNGIDFQIQDWFSRIYAIVVADDGHSVYAGGSDCFSDNGVLLQRLPGSLGYNWISYHVPDLTSIQQLVPIPGAFEQLLVVGIPAKAAPYPILGTLLKYLGAWYWTPISVGPPGSVVWQVYIDPKNPKQILADTTNGVYRSRDGGSTWGVLKSAQQDDRLSDSLVMDDFGVPFVSMFVLGIGSDVQAVYTWDSGAKQWLPTGLQNDPAATMVNLALPTRRILAGAKTGLWQYTLPAARQTWMPVVGGSP